MLAKHVGLAEGTVSRALNNYPDISQKTKDKVHEAARELGYRPNPTARRLAKGVAEAIAYIYPHNDISISQSFISQLLQGLSDSLNKRGWDLLLVQPSPNENVEEMIHKLISSSRVSGVVLSRPLKNDPRIPVLKKANFPFIVHGRSEGEQEYAWYDIDNEAAFIDATARLISLGHKRIGFIGADLQYTFAQMRFDGYREALLQNGIEFDESLIRIAGLSDDEGEMAARELLESENPPTALICITDMVALGAMSAIRQLGMQPGREISVIGYDGLPMGKHANPPLSTMVQPRISSGHRLGDMLMAIIDGGDPRQFQELHRAEFLSRETDRPIMVK